MLLTGVLIFFVCLLLSAFFSSSETAFIAVNPYSLEYEEKKGSRRAVLIRKAMRRTNDLLATILVGNTLVNAAAASVATTVFSRLVADPNQAVLYATVATTLLILVFGEINPKTFAAHNPLRTALFAVYPVRGLMILFAPIVRLFLLLTGVIMPSSKARRDGPSLALDEEEIKIALRAGARGLSALRRKMISGALDIGSRPVKEVMVPRPEIKAFEIGATPGDILEAVRSTGFSRYPVFRARLDNIAGILHVKDLVGYLIDNKYVNISSMLREPLFVPDLAPLEKVLVQMQEKAVHMALIVDEFGNVDGLVTLEDIIEELVGEIQDEHDGEVEDWISRLGGQRYLVMGSAPVKEVNARLALGIPEKKDYTTLAGFFLYEFGRLPREKDRIDFKGRRLTVEKMSKRHISLIQVAPVGGEGTAGA
jgi:putative hemolysin